MIIPFEREYREEFYKLEDKIFDSNFWSEGDMQRTFEKEFGEYVKLGARAVSCMSANCPNRICLAYVTFPRDKMQLTEIPYISLAVRKTFFPCSPTASMPSVSTARRRTFQIQS